MRVFNSESTQIMHTINSESPQSVRSTNSGSSQFMPTTNNGWTQPARTVQPTMHSPCKQSTSRTCRVRGGPRAMQMLKHPLKGAGSHPLTQAKSAQHCSATRRLPCKRAHITWPSGQHGRYSALVPCSNHMPHTFNTHSTHTLLPTHSTHTHTILAMNQKLARHMWVVSLPPPASLNGNRCCMLCQVCVVCSMLCQEATW
jgi:hypothetical protein